MSSRSYSHPNTPPSLGGTVREILVGWRQAAEACSNSEQVRAMLTLGTTQLPSSMFCWRNGQIQRFASVDSIGPASRSDIEVLDACIEHGCILIYQQIGPGCHPLILHEQGILLCVQDSHPRPDEAILAPLPLMFAEPQEREQGLHETKLPALPITTRPVQAPRRWLRWGVAILYVVSAPCGGFISFLLTRNPLMGWGSFIFLSALLWGGRVGMRYYLRRRQNVIIEDKGATPV